MQPIRCPEVAKQNKTICRPFPLPSPLRQLRTSSGVARVPCISLIGPQTQQAVMARFRKPQSKSAARGIRAVPHLLRLGSCAGSREVTGASGSRSHDPTASAEVPLALQKPCFQKLPCEIHCLLIRSTSGPGQYIHSQVHL